MHLVLVHHATDVYKKQLDSSGRIESVSTGQRRQAGWTHLGAIVDVELALHMVLSKSGVASTEAEFKLCRHNPELVGTKLNNPTWDKILQRIRMSVEVE